MRAVDTNLLVRLVTHDDAVQLSAAEEFVRPGAWVSHVVVVEFARVLASLYDLRPREVADAVEMLLEHPSLAFHEPEVVLAALTSFRSRPAVEFGDHLILALARKAGHEPLGTFDRRLGKLEGAKRL